MKQPVMIISCAHCFTQFNPDAKYENMVGLHECYFCEGVFVTCRVSLYYMMAFLWEVVTALAVQVDGGVWWKSTENGGETWDWCFIDSDDQDVPDDILDDLEAAGML